MTEPTPEAYETAARALSKRIYGEPTTSTPCDADALAAVDAVWPIAEATVRAKVAAETLLATADKLQQMTMDPFDLLTESTGVANAIRVALWLRDEAARIAEGNRDETKTSSAGPSGG